MTIEPGIISLQLQDLGFKRGGRRKMRKEKGEEGGRGGMFQRRKKTKGERMKGRGRVGGWLQER